MSNENSSFHQLLNLRAQENPEIIEWLRKRDEKYKSPEIQNELLLSSSNTKECSTENKFKHPARPWAVL